MLVALIIINVVLIDYFLVKSFKWLKNIVKINQTINFYDYEDDFWEED